MNLVPAVVVGEQSLVVMNPGEGTRNDPAHATESGAVLGLAASDLRADVAGAELAPVLVVVVAAVGCDVVGPPARTTDPCRAPAAHA